MAIQPTAVWYHRADATSNFGSGGFDPAMPNAGTNYASQASVQLELTDVATASAGSTTVTSATGGFTASMVGNSFGLHSGTNGTTGHYFVTGYVDANTVTVDRALDNGNGGLSGGLIRLGGAIYNLNGSRGVAGNTHMIRGSGDDDPTAVDFSVGSYVTLSSGDTTGGFRRWVGYNGRPHIRSNTSLVIHAPQKAILENFKLSAGGTTYSTSHAILNLSEGCIARNCIIDQNGIDNRGTRGGMLVEGCWFKNSGDATAGTGPAISKSSGNFTSRHLNNFVDGWKGPGFYIDEMGGGDEGNIIRNCGGDGVVFDHGSVNRPGPFTNNTIVGNAGAGIRFKNVVDGNYRVVYSNIIANNTGAGLVCDSNTTITNNLHGIAINRNAFYSNAGGNYSNISPGKDDVLLTTSPFRNYAAGDFRLNRSTIAGGLLTSIPSTRAGNVYADSFRDIGALQHDIAKLGASGLYYLADFHDHTDMSLGGDRTGVENTVPLVDNVSAGNWVQYSGSRWVVNGGRASIPSATTASGGLYANQSFNSCIASFDSKLSDYRITTSLYGHSTNVSSGLIFRHDFVNQTYFMLLNRGASNSQLYYYDGVSTGHTTLASVGANVNSRFNVYEVECVGDQISIYRNSALVYTRTDTNSMTATGVGIYNGNTYSGGLVSLVAIHSPGTRLTDHLPITSVGRQPAIPHPLYAS